MYVHKLRKFKNINFIRKCHKYNDQSKTDLPRHYDSINAEKEWYEIWEKNKYFQQNDSIDKTYRMLLPPPNITGYLHLGHALTVTIQDVLARWHKMKGFQIIWIPGFDHAGIATQAIVEKNLFKTMKIKRTEIKKEEFLGFVNNWKEDKSTVIRNQLKILGSSLDWSREYYTLNEHHSKAVTEAILTLRKRNLLFRDKSLINWCPSLGSALSDIEVEFETVQGKVDLLIPGYDKKVTFGQIYEISYNLKDSDEQLTVATTRPETLLGDVALAVHPDDKRYSHFIGQQVKNPLNKNYLPVIADSNVKMSFGTGIVKITPAHNKSDFNVAKNNNLDMIEIIGEDGKLTEKADQYQGLPRFTARKQILNDLANLGALKSVKDHEMQIPRCSRTGDIIELLLREQWFVNCKNMASRAYEAVKKGQLKFNPSFHDQTWYNWLTENNSRDWCISRQLWWGHRIPAYYCIIDGSKEWIIASSEKEAVTFFAKKYDKHVEVQQDHDVLDTWFSSALLPFSSLGWPNNTLSVEKYYPLSTMVTGHDILFFWVARMVMLGLELTDKLPFSEVLLHGVLCDSQKIKMSKSRGNLIFPESLVNGISLKDLNNQATDQLNMGILNKTEHTRTINMNSKNFPKGIPQCGADALRFTLCSHVIQERAISFNIVECNQNKFFLNKIWQSSKYTLQNIGDDPIIVPETYTMIDQWILSRLSRVVDIVNNALEEKLFHIVISEIKNFYYFEFCDYYLEATKEGFKNNQVDVITSHRYTLAKCIEVTLKLLAPITPYFSEDLYSRLSKKLSIFECKASLMDTSYPNYVEFKHLRNIQLEEKIDQVIKLIVHIRRLYSQFPFKNVEVYVITNNMDDQVLYETNVNLILRTIRFNNIKIVQAKNYQVTESNVIHDNEANYSVNLIFNDEDLFKEAKENEKKAVKKTKIKKVN